MKIINEDYEREFEKDSIYLLEEKLIIEQEYKEWLHNKEPAKISVTVKTIKKDEEYNILPF